MAMAKRVFFFILTNIAVMATISIIINIFGIGNYLTAYGLNYKFLLVFCFIWGMGGSFISLLLSKTMVKWSMGVKIIDQRTAGGNEALLLDMVRRLSSSANIPMPEVGIYESPELNAFATGASKSSSLVAVSTGLLESMSRDEVEGVIGHEITHISNGDMVTMVLIQGIVNAFAMFLSRVLSYVISLALSGNRSDDSEGESSNGNGISYMTYWVLTMVFDIVFTILGSLVTAAFSRYREYKADAGSAKIAGRQKMINALRALQRNMNIPPEENENAAATASLKISGRSKVIALFSTHPALEDRIAALEKAHI
jgi:heat shock protein HtpX